MELVKRASNDPGQGLTNGVVHLEEEVWVFAWEGNAHAIDWLCAHIVPQLLPQQEPFCRRALQTVIDTPWRDTDAMAGEAVQTALLATHFRITGPAPD